MDDALRTLDEKINAVEAETRLSRETENLSEKFRHLAAAADAAQVAIQKMVKFLKKN